MVDCVYYEEMNIDKDAIKKQFMDRFGNEYNLHEGLSDNLYIITADDVVNPTPEIYAEVLCGLSNKNITISQNCPERNLKRYYNSLSLLAMMQSAVAPSTLEELEGNSKVSAVRRILRDNFNINC